MVKTFQRTLFQIQLLFARNKFASFNYALHALIFPKGYGSPHKVDLNEKMNIDLIRHESSLVHLFICFNQNFIRNFIISILFTS